MIISESKLRQIIRQVILENNSEMLPDKPLERSLNPSNAALEGIQNMSFGFGTNRNNCLTIDKLSASLSLGDTVAYGNMIYSLIDYINSKKLVPKNVSVNDLLFVDMEESHCEPNEDDNYSPLVMAGEANHTVYDYVRTSTTLYTEQKPIGLTGSVEVPCLFGRYSSPIRFDIDEIKVLPYDPGDRYGKMSRKNERILERSSTQFKDDINLDIGNGGIPPLIPPSKRRGGGGGGGSNDELVYKVFFTNMMNLYILFIVPIDIQ